MNLALLAQPFIQFPDVPGGLLFTAMSGTGAGPFQAFPKTTYVDSQAVTSNPNPISLDSRGRASVFWDGYYDIALYDGVGAWPGNLVLTQSNVSGSPAPSLTSAQWLPQATPTYVSSTKLSVLGNLTTAFLPGTRLRATIASGAIYGTISATSAAGNPTITTVTVAWDSTALDNSVTAVALSIITGGAPTALPVTGIQNASIAAVATAYGSDTYLAGSCAAIPVIGGWNAKAVYTCVFDMTKTTAGTATIIITFRMGIAGDVTDTSIGTITLGAGTAAIDTGIFTVRAIFRTVGAGTSAVVQMIVECEHLLAATGLTNTDASGCAIVVGTTSGFDSTSQTCLGISFNGGTSFSGTNTFVQTSLHNSQ